MARPVDDYPSEPLRGPRRAETLPVRFDANPTQIPEGVDRQRGQRQRHVPGIPPSRDIINDENDFYGSYDDQGTARRPRRTFSPSPPPPEVVRGRSRSPPTPSMASIDRRRGHQFIHPGNYMPYQSTSHYNSAPPVIHKERIGDEYYFARAAATESPYYTRQTRSRSKQRSRSRSRNRYRYKRSRSSSHGRYGVPETKIAETDFGLSMPESESYPFRLSRHKKDSLQSELTHDSNSGYDDKETPLPLLQPHRSLAVLEQRPKIDRIIQSRYTGDSIMGGMHSVEFKVIPGQATSTGRLPVPLFNWVQFEDSSMEFDNFQNGVLNLDGLKEGEKFGISRLLNRVNRRYDKTLQISSRTKIKGMIPKLLQEPIRDEIPSAAYMARKLTWLCLPYFCLQKYTSSNVQASSHPPRTLLQTLQSMTPKERDLRQAVCHLPDTPAGACFHIGQAWFLILDDSFIISYAGLSTAKLNKDSISMVPYKNDNTGTLFVSDSGSYLWSFPIGECTTWFDFVKHFFELWPLGFEILYRNNTITPQDWPKVLKQAQRSKFCLEFKLSSKPKKPPTGTLNARRESFGGDDQNGHHDSKKDGATSQLNSNVTDTKMPKPDPKTKASNSASASVSSSPATKTLSSNEFHVFNWMNTHIDKSNSPKLAKGSPTPTFLASINEALLQDDLQEIDDYLLQKTNFSERFAYKASPRHTRKQFYDVLVKVESKIWDDQSLRATYELQVELANAAEALFEFFLSPQNPGPTTEKYWGPLYEIVIAMLPYGLIQLDKLSDDGSLNPGPHMFSDGVWSIDTRDVKSIIDWMELIGKRTELFRELLSEVPVVERCEINISDKLPRAWLHVLMALAFTKDMASPWYTHMNSCLELANEGMKDTVQTLLKYKLSDYAVFGPFDLASLLTFQLSQDLTGMCPDICETYVDYMRSLEFDIDADPINREHQGRITDLKQEISVVLGTLETQREVLHDAQHAQFRSTFRDNRMNRVAPAPKYEYKPSTFVEPRTINPFEPRAASHMNYDRPGYYRDNYEDMDPKSPSPMINQLSPNNPRGIQGLLFRESLALIEERIEVFRDINDRATYLENWNLRSIDTNKDRQETAVYAFTIVTIIFLPLSTVASILGMNTNDVRNMDLTQWLFWVIAIPLTIIIIGLVLIWSDEWYNFWSGFKNLWGKKPKRKYVRLPEEYPKVEPRTGLSFAPAARASGAYPGAYYTDGYYPPPPGSVPRLRRSRTIFGDDDYAATPY